MTTTPIDLDSELTEIAITALGRISVELFQPGGASPDLDFDTPEYDYLVKRDGTIIGYGELAEMFAAALREEIASRDAPPCQADGMSTTPTIEIKTIEGSVLYTAETAADVRSALVEAAAKKADLSGAYLSGADRTEDQG
ncbi:MAG TPA: hypothetical protein VNJ54_15155 [Plantibacter sp.]|uniref:hypothetical protein n=1 Tax=Plantibacter sp. TaxID=1871045 RepID=UPI002C5F2248|nr:hypothetical protein [Plantibacter sp.]